MSAVHQAPCQAMGVLGRPALCTAGLMVKRGLGLKQESHITRLGIYKHPSGCQEEKRLDGDPRGRKTRKGCDSQPRGTLVYEGGVCGLKRHGRYYSFIYVKWEKTILFS